MNRAPGLEVFGAKPSNVFAILAVGNHMIYQDIAWVALLYQEEGIKGLEKCKKSIDPAAYRGWVTLDKALHAKGEEKLELALEGSKNIVRREQGVLQSVLDSVEDKKLIRKLNPLLQVKPPPFKGAGWGLGDFGDLKYRLSRIYDVIIPSFLDYQFKLEFCKH